MKTTSKHFEIFKKECEKWIKIFGLLGHRFYYQHENNENAGNCIAYCAFPDNHEDRVFTLGLTKDLGLDYSIIDLKRSAFHEVMEAFLYRIRNIAGCRYVAPEEIEDEIHNIIRTLENVLWKNN
jgi:hypothetical protein